MPCSPGEYKDFVEFPLVKYWYRLETAQLTVLSKQYSFLTSIEENSRLQTLLSSTGLASDCFANPVGISDQSKIPDNRLTASSRYSEDHQPAYGRLNGVRGDGWCAKDMSRDDDWLQVDLGRTVEVCAAATQGDISANEWTTTFKLSYSTDGKTWVTYHDANGTKMVRMFTLTQCWFKALCKAYFSQNSRL